MSQKIQLTRCVRVFSSAVVLTAVAAIAAMQAHAATLYVTTDGSAFSWSTTANSGAGGVINTYPGPDGTPAWTDAFALAVTGSGSSGSIYVADAGTNKIYQYNKTSNNASSANFTTTGTGDTISPQEIALDSGGDLFTTSVDSGIINEYAASNGARTTFAPNLPGIRGIVIDGNVLWADVEGYGTFTLDSFSILAGGTFGNQLSTQTFTPSCGTGVVCGQVRGMAITGSGSGEVLYLADSTWTNGDGQIDKITVGATTPVESTLITSSVADLLDDPNSLASDGTGDLYVADYGNGDITEYLISTGALEGHWSVGGTPQGVILSASEGTGTAEDPDFFTDTSAPEPGTTSLLLLAVGVLGAGFWRRKISAIRLS